MRGDIYISAQGFSGTRSNTPLDPQVIDLVQAHPLIQSSAAIRVVTVESEHGPVELVAASTERPMDARLFLAVQENPEQAWQMLRDGAILLSEPLANRLGISSRWSRSRCSPRRAGSRFLSPESTLITHPRAERFA